MMYAPHMNRDTVRAATSRIDARAQVVALKMHPWHFTDARYDARNRWYLYGNRNCTARSCSIVASTSTPSTRCLLDGGPDTLVNFHTGTSVSLLRKIDAKERNAPKTVSTVA